MARDWQEREEAEASPDALEHSRAGEVDGLSRTGARAIQGLDETDISQESQAVEALQDVDGIRPEVWRESGEAERTRALQNVEDRMSGLQGRTPADVTPYAGGPGEHGYYEPENNEVGVCDRDLQDDSPREAVDTTVHEGRHAYQQHAIENPGVHNDPDEVEAWRENLQPGHYLTAQEYGQRNYQNQPVEADAWSYSRDVTDGLYGDKE